MGEGPRRTCAACRNEAGSIELIRWVRADDGRVYPDLGGSSHGRGAWIHPQKKCLSRLQKSLAASFKAQVTTSTEEGLELLGQAALHRASQLLGAAKRQNLLIFGADAVQEAYRRGEASHIVLASDAQAARKAGYLTDAVTRGRVVVWGTKSALGQAFGRGEVGILAVRDEGLATRLFGAIAMALLARGEPSRRSSEVEDLGE
jgi:uncharacterized protein